jgi:hypothetical protein
VILAGEEAVEIASEGISRGSIMYSLKNLNAEQEGIMKRAYGTKPAGREAPECLRTRAFRISARDL